MGMSRRELRRSIDEPAVVAAIKEAEKMTSGEIRVSVAPFFWGDVRRTAEKAFVRLGMTGTRDRNGVLFFVVPSRRKFVILGDAGIHEKEGQEFWDGLAAILSEHFAKGGYTTGLVEAIKAAGVALSRHFPYQGDKDVNELSDDVDFGGR